MTAKLNNKLQNLKSPLVCFYQDNKFVYSQSYELYSCLPSQTVQDFLNSFSIKFLDHLKIVHVQFEYDQQDFFSHQKELYHSAKAYVFVLYEYELLDIENIYARLENFQSNKKKISLNSDSPPKFKSLIDKNDFINKVKIIKNEIANGRVYQVNLTSPLQAVCTLSAEQLFLIYEKHFHSKYKALLPISENLQILSFSPELFLHQENNLLKTQPIKGSSKADHNFNDQLFNNQKENAELSMIVDLLRNDLNSLDQNNSATVTKHREQMQLGYIQHTYSEIQIKSQHQLGYALSKTMPGGSISGCPKIESLKLIAEVEPYKRKTYTGTIGWWKKNDFMLNLTIRSFIKTEDQLFYHSGCGIVYDSDPEKEWQEYLLKTGALNVHT